MRLLHYATRNDGAGRSFSTAVLIGRLRGPHGESLLVLRSAPGGRPGRVVCRVLLVQCTGEALAASTVVDVRRRGRRRVRQPRDRRPGRCPRRGWLVLIRVPDPERASTGGGMAPGAPAGANARRPPAPGARPRQRPSLVLVGLRLLEGRCRTAALRCERLQRYQRMRRQASSLRA